MKKISILFLCLLFAIFSQKANACDQSSATKIGHIIYNSDGSFTVNVEVCVEYLGLEGNPPELIFTFSPASVNILSFSPESYQTSNYDIYTGNANSNVLTYDGGFLPMHNEDVLCNTFSINFEGAEADELSIQTNDYPSPICTKSIDIFVPPCNDASCLESLFNSYILLAMPLGVPNAVSEIIDGNTYAPFYDAYKIKFTGGQPPYSFSGSVSTNAVKYYLDKQTNELTIYGPVSSTWTVAMKDANCCQQTFQRPEHVVPIISDTDVPLHISDYTFTPASSNTAYDGAIDITPATSIDNPSYEFLWLNDLYASAVLDSTEDISNLRKGTYYLNINNDNENFLCAFVLPFQSNKNEAEEVALLFDEMTTTNVTVFPNPVSDKAYVNIATNEEADAIVELYNINGQKVATIFEGTLSATNQFEFSTENLSNGLYFVKTTSSTGFQDAYKVQILR